MKKKTLFAVILTAAISVMAFAQETGGEEDSSTDRKFWGTSCHTEQTGADRSSTICCYYVFWINTGCHEAG